MIAFLERYITCSYLSGGMYCALEQGCLVLVTILEIVLKWLVGNKTQCVSDFYIALFVMSLPETLRYGVLSNALDRPVNPYDTCFEGLCNTSSFATSLGTFEIYLVKSIVSFLFSELLFPFFPQKIIVTNGNNIIWLKCLHGRIQVGQKVQTLWTITSGYRFLRHTGTDPIEKQLDPLL